MAPAPPKCRNADRCYFFFQLGTEFRTSQYTDQYVSACKAVIAVLGIVVAGPVNCHLGEGGCIVSRLRGAAQCSLQLGLQSQQRTLKCSGMGAGTREGQEENERAGRGTRETDQREIRVRKM